MPLTSQVAPHAPRDRNGRRHRRARHGVPVHRAGFSSTQRGTSHTAHLRPPTPAAAPSRRRKSIWATSVSGPVSRPVDHHPAEISRRRALSRDHPVTPTTSSRIRPLSPFAAFTYVLPYLVVTSARDIIDNPFLMPEDAHRYVGIPT